jgi:PAS domain S-box-containing protein
MLVLPWLIQMAGLAGLIGYFSHRAGQRAVERLAVQLMAEMGQRVEQSLEDYLTLSEPIHRLTQTELHDGTLNWGDRPQLEAALVQQLRLFPTLSAITLTLKPGQVLSVERFSTDHYHVYWVDPSQSDAAQWHELEIQGDRRSVFRTSTLPEPTASLHQSSTLLTQAANWRVVPVAQANADQAAVLYRSLLYDATGQVQGAIATFMPLTNIDQFLQTLNLGEEASVFLIDSEGAVLATSAPALPNALTLASQTLSPWSTLRRPSHPPSLAEVAVQQVIAPPSQSTEAQPVTVLWQQQRYLAAVTPLASHIDLPWQIVTLMPEAGLIADIHTNRNHILGLALVKLGLAGAIATLMTRYISRPIRALNQAIQQITHEDYDLSLPDTPIHELSELEQGISQMAQQIQTVFDNAESALRVSQEKFAKIFRMSPGASSITVLDTGRLIEMNQSYCDLLGHEHCYLVGQTTLALGLWPNVETRQRYIAQLREQGSLRQIEMEFRHASGDRRTGLLFAEKIQLWGRDCILSVIHDITDRKQSEAALAQSERRLRLLTDALPVYISYIDTQERYQFVNKIHESQFGLSSAAICGQLVRQVIGESNYAIVREHLQTGLAGHLVQQEITLTDVEHRPRIYSLVLVPDVDERQQVQGVYGLITDISDIKQTEAALRQSQARNLAILSALPDLMLIISKDGVYQDSIRRSAMDVIPAEINPVGRPISDFLEPAQAAQKLSAVQRAIATGQMQVYEQALQVNRQLQYEEVRVVPYSEQAALVILRDITHRKRAEAALSESEERFRFAFDCAGLGMTIVGLDGRFLKVNQALCEIVGYTETELLSMTFLDVTYLDDLDKTLDIDYQLLDGKIRDYQIEKRYVHKRGHVIWVLLSVALVTDADKKPLYFIEQIQDISDRRAIEDIKTEFVSIVSHELRTPITAIQGSIGLLQSGIYAAQPEKTATMLDIATQECDRLVRLVNDILDLERLNSGKVTLQQTRCDVSATLNRAIGAMEAIAHAAQITLEVSATAAYIWADPDTIVQTLTNLLSNAITFSPPGSTIRIAARPVNLFPPVMDASPPIESTPQSLVQPMVQFSIQDQGRGIPSDKLGIIFERFQQVDASDARQQGGTGLGLAICKTIVTQHGGAIWVTSEVGVGSTFYFTIPALCPNESY